MRARLCFSDQWRLFLFIGSLLLAAVTLSGGRNLAQGATERGPRPAVPILEYHTYDCGWLRYRNLAENGERKLAIENVTEFPFRYITSKASVELTKLEATTTLAEQLSQYEGAAESALATGEGGFDGACDTEKLSEKGEDVICVPGVYEMPLARVSLALFHPETFEIAALTTTIYNKNGDAARAVCAPPAVEVTPPGCGPYASGQWITAEEYSASALNLPVSTENTQLPILHYVCLTFDDKPSYLQAYPLISSAATTVSMLRVGANVYSDDDENRRRSTDTSDGADVDSVDDDNLSSGRTDIGYGVWCLVCEGEEQVGYVYNKAQTREAAKRQCEVEKSRRGGDCRCDDQK